MPTSGHGDQKARARRRPATATGSTSGLSWRCAVDITADTGDKLALTVSHSQFTNAEIGTPKPVTFTGSEWEAVDQPYEHRFAKTLLVLLLAGGIALLAKPLYNLPRIRDRENPDLPPRFLDVR